MKLTAFISILLMASGVAFSKSAFTDPNDTSVRLQIGVQFNNSSPMVKMRWYGNYWQEDLVGFKVYRRKVVDGVPKEWQRVGRDVFSPDFSDQFLKANNLNVLLKTKKTRFKVKNPKNSDILRKLQTSTKEAMGSTLMAYNDHEWAQALGLGYIDTAVEKNTEYEYAVHRVLRGKDGYRDVQKASVIRRVVISNKRVGQPPKITSMDAMWIDYDAKKKEYRMLLKYTIETDPHLEKNLFRRLLVCPVGSPLKFDDQPLINYHTVRVGKDGINAFADIRLKEAVQYKMAVAFEDGFCGIFSLSAPRTLPAPFERWDLNAPVVRSIDVKGEDVHVTFSINANFEDLSRYHKGFKVFRSRTNTEGKGVFEDTGLVLPLEERSFVDKAIVPKSSGFLSYDVKLLRHKIASEEFSERIGEISRFSLFWPKSEITQGVQGAGARVLEKKKVQLAAPENWAFSTSVREKKALLEIRPKNRPSGTGFTVLWFDRQNNGTWKRLAAIDAENTKQTYSFPLPITTYGKPLTLQVVNNPGKTQRAHDHIDYLDSPPGKLVSVNVPKVSVDAKAFAVPVLKVHKSGGGAVLIWTDDFNVDVIGYDVLVDGKSLKELSNLSPLVRKIPVGMNKEDHTWQIVKRVKGTMVPSNKVQPVVLPLPPTRTYNYQRKVETEYYDEGQTQRFSHTTYLVDKEDPRFRMIDGEHKSWWQNGNLQHSYTAVKGIITGPVRWCTENGKLYSLHLELNGKIVSLEECERALGKSTLNTEELTWLKTTHYSRLVGRSLPNKQLLNYRHVWNSKIKAGCILSYDRSSKKTITIVHGPINRKTNWSSEYSWLYFGELHGASYVKRNIDKHIMEAKLSLFGKTLSVKHYTEQIPNSNLPKPVRNRLLEMENNAGE